MRNLAVTILILFLIISCKNNQNSNTINNANDDTIIISRIDPIELSTTNYTTKSYFMHSNSDTSDFVCSISKNKNTGISTIWLKYISRNGRLIYFSKNIGDSSAVSLSTPADSITYLTCIQQTRQLSLTFDSISNEFEFNKARAIICFFDVNTDLKIELSNLINSKYGWNGNSIKSNDVVNLLYQTKFIEELNLTLSKFNRKADYISIDGFGYGPIENSKFYDFYGTIILNLGKGSSGQ